jgi:hypothetical protein
MDYHLVSVDSHDDDFRFMAAFKPPTGKLLAYFFPHHSLEARAGEYGLDPTADRDTLLDILLHEPFMDPLPEAQLRRDAEGAESKKGDLIHLFNAPTIEDAKKALLDRVAKTKAEGVKVIWDADTAQVLKNHPVDPVRVEEHRQRIFTTRGRLGREILPPKAQQPQAYDPAIRRRGVTVALLDT